MTTTLKQASASMRMVRDALSVQVIGAHCLLCMMRVWHGVRVIMHNLHVMAVLPANNHAQQAASTHPLVCVAEKREVKHQAGSLPGSWQLRCSIPRSDASLAYLHNLCTYSGLCCTLQETRPLLFCVESGRGSFVCAIAFQRE